MKKYFLFLLCLVFLDVSVCLLTNTNLVEIQKDYQKLEESLSLLEKENNRLEREIAHLTSFNHLEKEIKKIDLKNNPDRIVYLDQDLFAMR